MELTASPYEKHPLDLKPDSNLKNFIDVFSNYKDRLIFFLGAGASIGARNTFGKFFPGAWALRDEICEWAGFCDPHTLSLEVAAALAEERVGRDPLERCIADRFESTLPLWQHAVLPFLYPKALLTTNYDNLIEKGWSASGISKTLIHTNNPATINSKHIPLYKPHGTVGEPHREVEDGGLVITQFDYFKLLKRRREWLEAFMKNFEEHCVIFVGYSFSDTDIASYLFDLRYSRRATNWYAVFPRDNSDLREMYRSRYGIRQISRTFHGFLAELDEAKEFIPHPTWKFSQITQLVDDGKIGGPAPS